MGELKIEIIKIAATIISALFSALIIGTLWYASVNFKIETLSVQITQNKSDIRDLSSSNIKIGKEISALERDNAVEKAMLREITSRLDRMEGKIDKISDKR